MMRQTSWSNIVLPHICASVSMARGWKLRSENGWVGERRSPGAAPCGTGFSGAGTS
ncbi:hypothetical protein ACVWZR_000501 [Bradyrhizobium sp. i1.3.1]